MSRRRWLPLLLIVVLGLAALAWLTRGEPASEPSAPVVERASTTEAVDEPPTLTGTADGTVPPPTEDAPPAKPPRPWETRAGFDLAEEDDARAFGRVVFEGGAPAPDAFVWKAYVYRPFFRSAAEKGQHDFFVAATKTDADGRYRFSRKQIRTKLNSAAILARHGDQAALVLEPDDDGTRAQIPDLVLEAAIETRIDLVDAYGDPVPGALGQLRVHVGGKGIPALLLGDVSNAKGRLTFLSLPDWKDLLLEVELRHRLYPDLDLDLDMGALRRGEVLRIELPSGRTVRGTLVGPDGTPVGDAVLLVAGYDEASQGQQVLEGIRGTVDENGEFELRGVPAVEARLLVFWSARGEGKRYYKEVRFGTVPHHLVAIESGRHGDVLDLGRIQLERGGSISGVVRGGEGQPIEGALVKADLRIAGVSGGGLTRGTTDAEGRFRIDGLPPAPFLVTVRHEFPGFGKRRVRLHDVRPGGLPLDVRLTGGLALVLRLHPEGRPEEALRVKSYGYEEMKARSDGAGYETTGAFGGGMRDPGRSVLRFRFEPGTHAITFTAKGYEDVQVGPFEISADADTVIELELTPE